MRQSVRNAGLSFLSQAFGNSAIDLLGWRDVRPKASGFDQIKPTVVAERQTGSGDVIAGNMRDNLPGESLRIEVAVEAEPLSIGADHAVTLGLVVNEMATNAVE